MWNSSDGALLVELPKRRAEVSALAWLDSPYTRKPLVSGDWCKDVVMYADGLQGDSKRELKENKWCVVNCGVGVCAPCCCADV